MNKHFNRPEQKERRRRLRANLSTPEAILWNLLRGRQVAGFKFRRQYGVDAYVLDFYSPALKLALEVDGESHYTGQGQSHDRERTKRLQALGLEVLRVSNREVLENAQGVLETLRQACEARSVALKLSHQPTPPTPPWQGGEKRTAPAKHTLRKGSS